MIAPEKTVIDMIPLGRRITEIMKEKGNYYTVSAMAKRLGLSRETYRLMLKGERPIYIFELEKIAKDLKIDIDRITQEDIREFVREIDLFFSERKGANPISRLGKRVEFAIGESEGYQANMYVGRVLFEIRKYDLAHKHGTKAYDHALNLQKKYGESEHLLDALKFLMSCYTVKKDYESASKIVEGVKDVFQNDLKRSAILSYTLGMIACDVNRYEEAKLRFMHTLECCYEIKNDKEIGKALHNVAYMEYKIGNYESSKELFEKAIIKMQLFREERLISVKDYTKVFIAMNDIERARELIITSLVELSGIGNEVLEEKFRFLLAICDDDISGFLRDRFSARINLERQLNRIKEYVKILIKTKNCKKASEIIQKCFQYLEPYPELKGKFYLLYAIAINDVMYVEKLLAIPDVEKHFL